MSSLFIVFRVTPSEAQTKQQGGGENCEPAVGDYSPAARLLRTGLKHYLMTAADEKRWCDPSRLMEFIFPV
jgi:hypothetical protein